MPVATAGAVRALSLERVRDIGYPVILSNVYHLYLRPGIDTIASVGGLHAFTGWKRGILTDSGGFQLFSLNRLMKITDVGASFRSHIDGSAHSFTPETVIEAQMKLGSDIIMPLDHCTAPDVGYLEAQGALKRTTRWLARSVAYLNEARDRRETTPGTETRDRTETADRREASPGTETAPGTAAAPQLFGIVQGNFYAPLRTQSAEQIVAMNTPGYAIGGLSVGEERAQFIDMVAHTAQLLPHDKPRYLMGVGTPEYFLHAILHGIDMVDCVYPTRVARHGVALTADGKMDIRKKLFRTDKRPLEGNCECDTCRVYTRAYVHHLSSRKEIMAAVLLSEHNLFFMYNLCRSAQRAIRERRYRSFMSDFLSRYTSSG